MTDSDNNSIGLGQSYRVLARKYRPSSFDALIGQESLVRTLSNALEMGRLAHAFILTGLRGIGKTTTARIIAKGLNCMGEDGTGVPTLSPCGVCSSCQGIAQGTHVDVLEMDAASNTSVDDVREITQGVGYRPLSARYKIYIIDEVHMLSKSAFNALLKTLEEPPDSVKFIFATTEIRKVPLTVLSRCQRFDLRRVPNALMADHLTRICGLEGITAEAEAVMRIARAAEGSVRDALSMLDQAAALTHDAITDAEVATILGQADRQECLTLIEQVLAGAIPQALETLAAILGRGAEAQMVVRDMLDLLHHASRSATGAVLGDAPEAEKIRLDTIAKTYGIARLARAWQIALKGHSEFAIAPDPRVAAEMLIIRLAYASTLPPPAEILRKLEQGGGGSTAAANMPEAKPLPSAEPAPSTAAVTSDSVTSHPLVAATLAAFPGASISDTQPMGSNGSGAINNKTASIADTQPMGSNSSGAINNKTASIADTQPIKG